MSSTGKGDAGSRSIALRLTLFYVLFFGVVALVGGTALFQLVRHHVLSELDSDIAHQKDEFVRVVRHGQMQEVAEAFRAFEKSTGKKDGFVRLLDDQGRVLAASSMEDWPDMPVPQARPDDATNAAFTTLTLPDNRLKARLIEVAVPKYGYLQMGVSLKESEALFSHFSRYGIIILAVMLAWGAPVGWLLARRAMAGVEAVTRTANRVAEGHFSDRVDVSGHGREIDELVRAFNRMAERVQSIMGEMRHVNDNIAHDLRSPLTRIRGLAEHAALNSADAAESSELAGAVVEECDRLMQMINTMLDISEAEAGIGRLRLETVDVNDLAGQAIELFSGVAEDLGVRLEFARSTGQVLLQGDRRKLERVLANMIDNAVKYTPRGGRVRVRARQGDDRVEIEIDDTGIGIATQDLARIFDRFYRADESRHQTGNGLGLSLVQAVLKAHGGSVSVSSSPGYGSTFVLAFPDRSS